MLLCIYVTSFYIHLKCNLDLNKIHSTVLCSLMYYEVVSNYLQNGSNVYSCLLDASKAFDRIHFGKLFAILIERNVPLCFIASYTGCLHKTAVSCVME